MGIEKAGSDAAVKSTPMNFQNKNQNNESTAFTIIILIIVATATTTSMIYVQKIVIPGLIKIQNRVMITKVGV